MMDSYNKIIELVRIKREKITTKEDIDKCNTIETLLEDKECFFKMKATTSFGILKYLGIEDDSIVNMYFDLISPEHYKNKVVSARNIDIKKSK